MASKKPRRKSVKAKQAEESPKFLLEDEDDGPVANIMSLADDESSVTDDEPSTLPEKAEINHFELEEADDVDWPERDDIRDGLIGHVRKRFGIDPDVAERAINDILRIA